MACYWWICTNVLSLIADKNTYMPCIPFSDKRIIWVEYIVKIAGHRRRVITQETKIDTTLVDVSYGKSLWNIYKFRMLNMYFLALCTTLI